MSRSSDMGDYLRARRTLLDPQAAGFAVDRHRRVTGLRREEVAQLAGISPEYYLRLEQGRDHLPSAQVLNALAQALQLDDVARAYLERLSRPRMTFQEPATTLRDDLSTVRTLFSQWTNTAAFISDRNLDIVHANSLADEIGQGRMSVGGNALLSMFDPERREHDMNWETNVARVVGALRLSSDPLDPRLQQIVGHLSLLSPDFRRIWARQDVAILPGGPTTLQVNPFGQVEFVVQNFSVPCHDGYTMTTVFAQPESPAVSVMAYLAARADAPRAHDIQTAPVPAQA
jgi:transcriptional regulator with XRE-family HTH domain